jgi:hypothetical protein
MDFARLDSNDRTAVIASAVVLVLGIVSFVNEWGNAMLLSIIGALAMLAFVFMPQLLPTTALPAPRGLLMLAAGGIAALFWLIAAIDWLGYIVDNLGNLDTLQFLVGFVASLVMAWAGWQAFQAGTAPGTSGAAPADRSAPGPGIGDDVRPGPGDGPE